MSVSVELLDVRFSRAVDRYVVEHPAGTPFHETRWTDLVRMTFGFETRTLVAADDTSLRGVLPLGLVAAPITGRRLVSVPFGVYGGILASDPEAIGALDQAARLLAERLHVRYVECRYLGPGPTHHPGAATHETYRRELPGRADEVLGTIPRKARAEVRKARNKHGGRFVEGRDLLPGFYRLYDSNKRSLGSPLFRRSYFQRLLELFGHRAVLHGLVIGDELVGAVLSMVSRDTVYPYYSGAVPEATRLGANNAMYASLMEWAVERGLRVFDFGRSRIGSGPAAFKRHMGFEPTPLDYQFYFPYGGRPPRLGPGNPAMALPRRILASLPSWLAQAVGPSLMRQVP